jgi:DeoR/GlpR family transcriptional regulator of sugar metabolism
MGHIFDGGYFVRPASPTQLRARQPLNFLIRDEESPGVPDPPPSAAADAPSDLGLAPDPTLDPTESIFVRPFRSPPMSGSLVFLVYAWYFLFVHGSLGPVRKNEIESRLLRGLPVNATALAKEFLVSEDAIRRDLRALAAEGKCKRVYGGGLPIAPGRAPFEHRLLSGSKEKRALALAALTLVSEASTVFLDSGSTNLALAREMPQDRSLTIATNSISIANALLERKNFKVIVLGGEIDRETGAAIGLSAIREAERLSFDLCFLGACAVSVSLGIGAFYMADAEFKRTLIARSDRIATLITMDKIETRAPFQVAAMAVLDHLVLESGTSEEIVSTFSNAGPKVIIGQP